MLCVAFFGGFTLWLHLARMLASSTAGVGADGSRSSAGAAAVPVVVEGVVLQAP